MLKSILKLCCAYRTGLTPFYGTNSHTVDLKDGDFPDCSCDLITSV